MGNLIQRVLLYIFAIAGVISDHFIFGLAIYSQTYKRQDDNKQFFHLSKILRMEYFSSHCSKIRKALRGIYIQHFSLPQRNPAKPHWY